MFIEKVIEKFLDEYWLLHFFNCLSLVLPGFVYIRFVEPELFKSLDIIKLLLLSLFYSLIGYTYVYIGANNNRFKRIAHEKSTQINIYEKKILSSSLPHDVRQFIIDKLNKDRIKTKYIFYNIPIIILGSLYMSATGFMLVKDSELAHKLGSTLFLITIYHTLLLVGVIMIRFENFVREKYKKNILKKYLHYKGNQYELIAEALHSETLEEMVVYRALYGEKKIWVRPKKMFFENVIVDEKEVPRFQKIEE